MNLYWVTEYRNLLGMWMCPTRRHKKVFYSDSTCVFTTLSTLMMRIWKRKNSENESEALLNDTRKSCLAGCFFFFSWYVIVNPHLGDSWEIFLVGGTFQHSNQMKISDLTTKLRYNAWHTAVLQTVLLACY